MRSISWALGLVGLLALSTPSHGQTPESVGNFVSYASIGQNEWKIFAQNAQVRVQFFGPAMVRVRYSRSDQWEDQSFAVVGKPLATTIKVADEAQAITFVADSVRLRITKNPLRVELYNKAGQLVNQDEPAFGTTWIGEQVTAYKQLQKDERFVGLGEKTGPLNRRGEGYTNWNTDAFGYGSGQDPIYQSIPFYIGMHSGLQYGVFMDNSYKSHFVFGASNERFSSFTAEAGEMDYYLIYHNSVADIIKDYTYLTGRMPMPPLWGLGLQQARYSYYPEAEVRTLAKTYRDKQIPADAIVLDIHYMDKYKIFTWDKSRFPDPKGMVSDLRGQGFHTVTIHDPGIKVEPGYAGYDSGVKADIFARYPDGKYHISNVWPGRCHFPEFGRAKTTEYWRNALKKAYTDNGVEGFWNDMNEPATWGNRFPDLVQFRVDDTTGKEISIGHRRMHNIYGLLMSKASYEAGRTLLGKRPFILTRAGYAGIQRYSAVWTGDNRSEDDHMMAGVRLLNSMGLSGIAYTGMDVGGFTGNGSPALFGRWVTIGAFSPFFRIHSAINTKEADPWSFGEEIEATCKNFINLRYRMLPYLYSAFYEASQTGMPINRSLVLTHTHDAKIYEGRYQNQFWHGPSLLVCPSESGKEFTQVYLPGLETGGDGDKEQWYDLYTGRQIGSGEAIYPSPVARLPVFVKGSAIIPMQRQIQSTLEPAGDTLMLHVYDGRNASAFTYYEDDGESFNHEKGDYRRQIIRYSGQGVKAGKAEATLTFEAPEGPRAAKYKFVKVMRHSRTSSMVIIGKKEQVVFIEPLPNFDPIGTGGAGITSTVYSQTMAMPAGRVVVKL